MSSFASNPGQLTLEQYRELGKRANSMGESLAAYDAADEGLKTWSQDRELRHIQALALARMGSTHQAHEMLLQLRKEANDDEETLGLLARTYKDLWLKTGDPVDLKQAYDSYAKAYRLSSDRYWTGINAATLAHAAGKRKTASEHAARILNACVEKLKTASGDEVYWLTATIAEAALVLGDITEAERSYAEAARIAHNNLGYLSTTRRNAGIVLRSMAACVATRIEQALQMPKVAIFAGHRVDDARRRLPRFPNESAPAVAEAIRQRLLELNARVGYSSAASGSDILFAEAMRGIGGQTHIVLPCNEEQFIAESVASSGAGWADRFTNVVKSAHEVIIASDQRLRFGSIAYDYANELLYGLAKIQTDQLATELVRVAVWDGSPGDGPGGTADIVQRWQSSGDAVHVINPIEFTQGMKRRALRPSRRRVRWGDASGPPAKPLAFASEIRAMLFADAYHFSELSEEQVPNFIRHFMAPIAALSRQAKSIYQNTWGDGLFFVFPEVGDAGQFALKLADRIARIDRKAVDLPAGMSLRIALHVGPVYRFRDRIIRKLSYIGSHVNRVARIEPVTPPGEVYASDAFAALAALRAPGQFRFDYVGRIPLAKNFGDFPMYHLQRQQA